ncbi:pyocin knob domain-containing protein [Paenibacillus amylolyticus]|nr:pyocin knob domain-containing protein [Paenibacillus amylolyticus]WFR62596.1 pyocin knob domain-containing protein [Paenibacillus amylolyticus]
MPKETDRLKLPLPLGNENVTRESINRIFEKIDAGVATRESILIPAESDLNSYITEGEYYCPTNATVGTLLNSPTGEAFHLTVEPHAGVLQTLTTFQPGNLEVFQRNYYFGWGAWKKVPTRAELEEMLNQTDENAQGYATAAVKPIIEGYSPNLVKNSSANLGLSYWAPPDVSSYWAATTGADTRLGKYFFMGFSLTSGLNAALDSDSINVRTGDYMLQAVFYTFGMNEGNFNIEVINAASNATITSLAANGNMDWHRKTKVVTIPTGVSAIKLRLVVSGPVTNTTKAITRIKFSRDSTDVPYSAEGDDLALFEKGQMFKLTNDSGRVKSTLSTINFNDLIAAGQYFVNPSVPNAPVGGGTGGFYVEVIVSSDLYILQRATKQNSVPTLWVRTKQGGVWGAWVLHTQPKVWGAL